MSGQASDAKIFHQRHQRRRQWITFVRMVRYGINNFTRNAWLTIAATAVMTITLLSIFMTFAARDILINTVQQVQEKTNLSIYVKTDISQGDVDAITSSLQKLSTVKALDYVSPTEAREQYAKSNKSNSDSLKALNEATNRFPGIFNIELKNINDTSQLDKFVDTDATYKKNAGRTPSWRSNGGNAINTIASWVGLAEKVGYVMSAIFVALAMLIVFNTIRMAIFNRKEEIQMMKLIGADSKFIRGPFIVEAIVYGFIAAIIATALGVGILIAVRSGLSSFGTAIGPTVDSIVEYLGIVLLLMILTGAVIGVVSSMLATRKHLRTQQ